jgi:hypothetical protein
MASVDNALSALADFVQVLDTHQTGAFLCFLMMMLLLLLRKK